MMPPPIDILKGMIPGIPDVSEGQGNGPLLVIASLVGTTVFSGLFIIRTTLVKEAGWTINDLKKQRNDAIVSVTLMFVISAAIMAAAAGTLYAEGIGLSNASQMITHAGTVGRKTGYLNFCHWNCIGRCFVSISKRADAPLATMRL